MPALPRSILLLWLAALVLPAQGQAPLTATQPLLELYQPEGAALSKAPGTETTTVFRATAKSHPFNHRASPIAFNGRLFVQWQASRRYSDGPETQVRYAMSVDGRHWSDALVLARPRANARVSSGGWWAFGDTLVAYINVWPKDAEGGFVEYRTSRNGIHWTAPKPVLDSRGQPLAGAMEPGRSCAARRPSAHRRVPAVRPPAQSLL